MHLVQNELFQSPMISYVRRIESFSMTINCWKLLILISDIDRYRWVNALWPVLITFISSSECVHNVCVCARECVKESIVHDNKLLEIIDIHIGY